MREPWAHWTRSPIPVDASPRRYTRLTGPNGEHAIEMQSGTVPTKPFVQIAGTLNALGLVAPEILYQNGATLVISDLGQTDMATALTTGANPQTLYRAAVDVLAALHNAPRADLSQMTPDVGGDMVRITAEYYAPNADGDTLACAVTDHLTQLCGPADKLALRDFHVENLIWRPQQTGTNRVGLLDFQDAFVAPAGYDLASLLRDVRHDVPQDVVDDATTYFCTQTGLNVRDFTPQRAILGAQRNLRILGVFARLINVEGKPKYRAFMPRVWRNIQADLAHPALSRLQNIVDQNIPDPAQAGFT